MSWRFYVSLMSIGTLLCWVAWFFVLYNIAPDSAGVLGLLFFYCTLFLALLGTISVLWFFTLRLIKKSEEAEFIHIGETFRHSLLASSAIIILLLLLANNLLFWWNAPLLLIIFIFIEVVIVTHRRREQIE